MPLTINRTLPTRAALQAALRLAGLALAAWGAVQITSRLLFGTLGNQQLSAAWTVWNGIADTHGIFRGLPIFLLGAALLAAAKPLATWIVRPPAQGCPRCGYARERDEPCPECGERCNTDNAGTTE
ncbi:MAG: hypothetical protein AAF356_13070 [Planctomycetota bacterium]